MDTASELILIVLAIVAFTAAKDGKLGDWARAKFFNAAEPTVKRTQLDKELGKTGGWFGDLGATGSIALANPIAGGAVGSGFGPRKSPGGIGSTNHKGVDIGATAGTSIGAAAPGKVTFTGASGGYGLRVDVDHGGGIVTRYAHMRRITVKRGAKVGTGSQLGEVGDTGTATAPHLHFEVRRNGTAVDPAPYLAGQSVGATG